MHHHVHFHDNWSQSYSVCISTHMYTLAIYAQLVTPVNGEPYSTYMSTG